MHLLRAAAAVFLAAAALSAPPDEADFAQLKRQVTSQLSSRIAAHRAGALRSLADHPSAEAAKLLVERGLKDRDRSVREAAFDTLLRINDRPAVVDYLAQALRQQTRARKPSDLAAWILPALLAAESADARRQSDELLDELLASSPAAAAVVVELAGRAQQRRSPEAVRLLVRLATAAPLAEQFALRRTVVGHLLQVPTGDAVSALVELLPRLDGEIQADVAMHLRRVTGQKLDFNAPAWAEWWRTQRATFVFPPLGSLPAPDRLALSSPTSYYGMPIYARRLVFVIDVSSSMAGARLQAAQRELVATIDRLPEDKSLAILAYNDRAYFWRRELSAATAEAKASSRRFVEGLRSGARTATFDALEAALRGDAEAIYLLTDGEPTAGRVVASEGILAAVAELNRSRRMSIYTIGLAPGPIGGRFDAFLRELAEENQGGYRRLEQ